MGLQVNAFTGHIMESCKWILHSSSQSFSPFLYFFSRTEGYRKVPYHYYEQGRDECDEYFLHEHAPYGGHRFITEKKVFAKWAKKHRIIFTHPNWTVSWCWLFWPCHTTWHDHDTATVMLMMLMLVMIKATTMMIKFLYILRYGRWFCQ